MVSSDNASSKASDIVPALSNDGQDRPHPSDSYDLKCNSTTKEDFPEEQEDAIANLPVDAKLQKKAKWSSLFTVAASGAALISDGYQNNLMTMLNVTFAKRYGSTAYSSAVSTRVSNSLLVGAIIGQISVGLICDRVGRKAAIVIATLLIVVGGIFATAATPVHGNLNALFWWLTVARGAIGVGVGGEYPASSVSASEAANERYGRSQRSTIFILCTNLVLSFGGPLAVSIFLIILNATNYGNSTPLTDSDAHKLDIVWRVAMGVGIVLPLSVFYFRLRMLDSKLYRKGAIRHKVPYILFVKRYWRRLIGTAGLWFLYDIVSFSNGAFSGTIISSVLKTSGLQQTAEYQLLLGSIALPGAIIGAFLVKKIGTRWQMICGFGGYLVVGLIVGLAWDKVITIPALFVVLYGLFTSLGNLGPGSICGLVSSESYPSGLRGTAYGLSAAIGKTGAAIGVEIFTPISNNAGKKWTFVVGAGIGLLGILVAFFFLIDTTKLDLEEEDRKWLAYIEEHGWRGAVGTSDEALVERVEEQQKATQSCEALK